MILFEWDINKALSNHCKHGITFAVAEQDRIEAGERRWRTIGMLEGVVVLLVAHTVREEGRDEIIRIVSARRATRKERNRYEQNRQKDSR